MQCERIKLIVVAQEVGCVEQMDELRLQRLSGAQLGYANVDEVPDAITKKGGRDMTMRHI